MSTAPAVAIGACAIAAWSCAAVIGLEDHELAPPPDDAGANDAPVDECAKGCATGYACVDGHCTNEVAEIGASETHACAVLRGGELWCWGKNQFGALGVDPNATPATCGAYACSPTPVKAAVKGKVAHVAVGQDFTCALDAAGTLYCFGVDSIMQLARAAPDSCVGARGAVDGGAPSQPCDPVPGRVASPTDAGFAQIVAASDTACARTSGGDIACWGDDYLAAAGVFPFPDGGAIGAPQLIPGIAHDATGLAISGSYAHACAPRGPFASLSCWGSNAAGELGHAPAQSGDKACIFTVPCSPSAVGANQLGAGSLALGEKVTCVRKGDGTVSCFGGNDSGQLGNGVSVDAQPHPTPEPVAGLSNVVAIAGRFATLFAIDGAGHVFAWGLAINGALGVPANGIACAAGTCMPMPTIVPGLDGTVAIAPTRYGGVALKNDGTIVAWGMNDTGLLGHVPGAGDTACESGPCRQTPVIVGGLPK